jgi:peptidoglycan/xylan/chitin deacetylase (PgdA/CDA1 family)
MSRLRALAYHDVVPDSRKDSSGFTGLNEATYKISPERFDRQMAAIRNRAGEAPSLLEGGIGPDGASGWVLTFDDGGISAYDHVLESLGRLQWKAFFFITTDRIGDPGFLDREQIRILRKRGHRIGSHSCTHPNMILQGREEIGREWRESIGILSDLLGEPVDTAAVPGGFVNADVERAAESAGIRLLFTSTPTLNVRQVGRCAVVGRFSIKDSTPDPVVAELARGASGAWLKQKLYWAWKRSVKAVLGGQYKRLRAFWFRLRR